MTLGADKNHDTHAFVKELRQQEVTPHVAQNDRNRIGAFDARTTRYRGYAVNQKKRKQVEGVFSWIKDDRPDAEGSVSRWEVGGMDGCLHGGERMNGKGLSTTAKRPQRSEGVSFRPHCHLRPQIFLSAAIFQQTAKSMPVRLRRAVKPEQRQQQIMAQRKHCNPGRGSKNQKGTQCVQFGIRRGIEQLEASAFSFLP